MNPTWKAALGVIVIFILGWFGGALSTLIVAHHKIIELAKGDSRALTTLLERQTTRGLKLDEGQRAKVHDLLQENVHERKELQKQIQPQVWTDNRQTLDAINAVLTPEQRKKFQDNLLLFEAHFGRNPLNTGPEESAPTSGSASTNAAIGNPPPK